MNIALLQPMVDNFSQSIASIKILAFLIAASFLQAKPNKSNDRGSHYCA